MEELPILIRICLLVLGLLPGDFSVSLAGRCKRWLWIRFRNYKFIRGEASIRAEKQYGYGTVAFAFLTLIVVGQLVDLIHMLKIYTGREHDVVFVITYLTYLPHLTITLLFCIAARLYLSFKYDPGGHRLAVFSYDYLNKCQELEAGFGLWWRFVILMTLPVCCICFKFAMFITRFGDIYCKWSFFVYNRTLGGAIGYALYGCFCFVICSFRKFHLMEFYQAAVRISENGDHRVELSKAEVRRLCLGYRSFQNLTGIWMMFSVCLSVLGIGFLVPYTMTVIPNLELSATELRHVALLTVHIWFDKILFLFGPLFAVGGLDIGKPLWSFREWILTEWDNDRTADMNDTMSDPKHIGMDTMANGETSSGNNLINGPDDGGKKKRGDSKALKEILKHFDMMKGNVSWIKPTLILSLVGVYMAITLDPSQDPDPWIGFDCRNLTNITGPASDIGITQS